MIKLDKINQLLIWVSNLKWDVQILIGIILFALVLTTLDAKKERR